MATSVSNMVGGNANIVYEAWASANLAAAGVATYEIDYYNDGSAAWGDRFAINVLCKPNDSAADPPIEVAFTPWLCNTEGASVDYKYLCDHNRIRDSFSFGDANENVTNANTAAGAATIGFASDPGFAKDDMIVVDPFGGNEAFFLVTKTGATITVDRNVGYVHTSGEEVDLVYGMYFLLPGLPVTGGILAVRNLDATYTASVFVGGTVVKGSVTGGI